MLFRLIAVGAAALMPLAPCASAQDRSATRADRTFNRDVAPIIFEHCAPCHRPGEAAPFNLLTYAEVRRRATQIAAATSSGYMPPWKPVLGYGDFAGVRRLSPHDIDLIRQWVDQGAVEGDPGDLRPAPQWPSTWHLGRPDLIVSMPEPYVLAAEGTDVFRTFVLPLPIGRVRHVAALEVHPGAAAVHHANLKIDRTRSSRRFDDEDPEPGFDGGSGRDARFPDGHFLGWTPGQVAHRTNDTAWRLDPGSDLVVEAHMTPTGKPEAVRISVGFFFTDKPSSRHSSMLRLGRQTIDIPAGAARHIVTDSYLLPVDVDVLRVQPHAHLLARQMEAFARLPDGDIRWLIRIDDWDFRWQEVYRYTEPLSLPRGATIVARFTYDNSESNPRNPHRPPRRVTFGQRTMSEMGDLWLQVATGSEADRTTLERDYAPKMLMEDIAGAEKALAANPGDARLHTDLALCYLEAGRTGDALTHLTEAVRLQPASPAAHYELGTLLLRERRIDQARDHFARAAALKPAFSEAHNNLGVSDFLAGRLPDAIRAFRDAVGADADNAEAHFNLGRALAAENRVEEALEHYGRALALRPDDADTRASLGSLLAAAGRVQEAVVHYRRALEAAPELAAALVDLAWILATSEDPAIRAPREAVGLAERAATLSRQQDATVLDTLAMAYFAAGQFGRAVATAEAALERARTAGQLPLVTRVSERLEFYRQHQR